MWFLYVFWFRCLIIGSGNCGGLSKERPAPFPTRQAAAGPSEKNPDRKNFSGVCQTASRLSNPPDSEVPKNAYDARKIPTFLP